MKNTVHKNNVKKVFSKRRIVKYYSKTGVLEEEKRLLKLLRKGKVLDLGWGDGRISVFLAKRGFEVVSVDISPEMIDSTRRRCEKQKCKIEFLISDASEYIKKNSFDNVIIMQNTLELAPSSKELRKILKNCYESLKEKGVLIASFTSFFYPPKRFLKVMLHNMKCIIKNDKESFNKVYFKFLGEKRFNHKTPPLENKKNVWKSLFHKTLHTTNYAVQNRKQNQKSIEQGFLASVLLLLGI